MRTSPLPETSKHYTQKATLELELPTATEKLRTTNECLISSLCCLSNCTGKVVLHHRGHCDSSWVRQGCIGLSNNELEMRK